MAYNVSENALGAYVAENKDIILKDIVFGETYGNTVPLMQKELGIKGTAKIHPTTIAATLQEGGKCDVFTPQGDLNITEVEIVTKQYKVNSEFCADKLIGKFAEYKVRVSSPVAGAVGAVGIVGVGAAVISAVKKKKKK